MYIYIDRHIVIYIYIYFFFFFFFLGGGFRWGSHVLHDIIYQGPGVSLKRLTGCCRPSALKSHLILSCEEFVCGL